MGKRREGNTPVELPLFDLPLQPASAASPAEPTLSRPALPAEAPLTNHLTQGSRHFSARAPGASGKAAAPPPPSGAVALRASASWWDRFLAGLIDLVLIGLAVGAAALGALLLGARLTEKDAIPLALLGLILSFLYWVIPLAFWGQTPGMSRRGLISVCKDRQPLTFGQTVRRWFGALLTLALGGLPILLCLGRGGSLSDRLSYSETLEL